MPRRAGRRGRRFLQVSTDEVYGSRRDGQLASRTDPLAPRSPYAAAKAAGELLVRSYVVTYGLDAVITRGSNTYGPYHHPEKLIPLFITNAIDDQPLPLYGDGLQRRDWLYVADHAGGDRATSCATARAARPTTCPGGTELTNRDVVAAAPRAPRQAVVARPARRGPARPRPALRDGRLEARGPRLANRTSFEDGLAPTVDWFVANEAWWRAARSGDWDAYYERQYGRADCGVPAAGCRRGRGR